MLRTVFAFTVLGLWTMVCAPLAALTVLFTSAGDVSIWVARRMWSPVLVWAAQAQLSVAGAENFDPSRPVIYVCNHQGMLDIPALFIALHTNRLRFVAKKSLRAVPFLGWYMWLSGYVFVDRGNHHEAVQSLDAAGEKIRAGTSVVVFPEGTRSSDGHILPFKKGPFMLALKAQVPIVPIAVEGSYRILNKHSLWVTAGQEIRMRIGSPISTEGMQSTAREELMKRVRDQIIDLHREIGGLGGDKTDAIAARGVEGIGKAGKVFSS